MPLNRAYRVGCRWLWVRSARPQCPATRSRQALLRKVKLLLFGACVLLLRYPYCLGLLLQTKFQTIAAYLAVHLHNPKFLVLRYPYCLGLFLQTKFQTRAVYLSVHLFQTKFLVLRFFNIFAISGQGPPGQAWGAGMGVGCHPTGRPAPPSLSLASACVVSLLGKSI